MEYLSLTAIDHIMASAAVAAAVDAAGDIAVSLDVWISELCGISCIDVIKTVDNVVVNTLTPYVNPFVSVIIDDNTLKSIMLIRCVMVLVFCWLASLIFRRCFCSKLHRRRRSCNVSPSSLVSDSQLQTNNRSRRKDIQGISSRGHSLPPWSNDDGRRAMSDGELDECDWDYVDDDNILDIDGKHSVRSVGTRKRDRIMSLSRTVSNAVRSSLSDLRDRSINIGNESTSSGGQRRFRKRRAVLNFAKRMIGRTRSYSSPTRNLTAPPASFLEGMTDDFSESVLPSDIMFLLKSTRVFGHFEEPVFLELYKHTESLTLPEGSFLFQQGDIDDSIYVVISGHVVVSARTPEGDAQLNDVLPGESLASLLSILDVVCGRPSTFKTVSAKATADSVVVKLSAQGFIVCFLKYPHALIQFVQTIVNRLHQVTFTTLYRYLGLTTELVNPNVHYPLTRNSQQSNDNGEDVELTENENSPSVSDEETLHHAMKTIADFFGVSLSDLTSCGHYSLYEVASGENLIKHGNRDSCLYYLISGQLCISLHCTEDSIDRFLYTVEPGELSGPLALLSGEHSFINCKASRNSKVVRITKDLFYDLVDKKSSVLINTTRHLLARLSPLVRQVDFALDWVQVNAGKAIYKQGECAEGLYVVLNGRVRSVITTDLGKESVDEFGRGQMFGEVEVLTSESRATTVHAIRDTELAKVPNGLFHLLQRRYPAMILHFSRLLSSRLLNYHQSASSRRFGNGVSGEVAHASNIGTVAVLAVSTDVPLTRFCEQLGASLSPLCPALHLNSNIVTNELGIGTFEANKEYQLLGWLCNKEEDHDIVIYECDNHVSSWTQRCIRQADCILVVGLGNNEPSVGLVEKELESVTNRAQKELVLLWQHGVRSPSRTVEWLNLRNWCNAHHHLRVHSAFFQKHTHFEFETSKHSDFARLARRLTGNSIGIVLGGGGARGLAHIGVLKVLAESGIPVDAVGGTSQGAFIGALFAEELDWEAVNDRSREWCQEMGNYWLKVLDLTYPATAMFSGAGFNACIRRVFRNKTIEDLWIPYFCITTDISHSQMRVHRSGSLWRYVRASMSLSGYLPPICDPVDGAHLLDGGYVNNLPADVMQTNNMNVVFAVDVGAEDDTDLTNFGDELSGWWMLWKRFNPFSIQVKIPNLAEIQDRLAYVSCVRQLEQVKATGGCIYMRPPVDMYKTLQFHAIDDIREAGYRYAHAYIAKHCSDASLASITGTAVKREESLVRVSSAVDLPLIEWSPLLFGNSQVRLPRTNSF